MIEPHTVQVFDTQKGRTYRFVQFGELEQVRQRVATWNAEHEGHRYTLATPADPVWPSRNTLRWAWLGFITGVAVAVASAVYMLNL